MASSVSSATIQRVREMLLSAVPTDADIDNQIAFCAQRDRAGPSRAELLNAAKQAKEEISSDRKVTEFYQEFIKFFQSSVVDAITQLKRDDFGVANPGSDGVYLDDGRVHPSQLSFRFWFKQSTNIKQINSLEDDIDQGITQKNPDISVVEDSAFYSQVEGCLKSVKNKAIAAFKDTFATIPLPSKIVLNCSLQCDDLESIRHFQFFLPSSKCSNYIHSRSIPQEKGSVV